MRKKIATVMGYAVPAGLTLMCLMLALANTDCFNWDYLLDKQVSSGSKSLALDPAARRLLTTLNCPGFAKKKLAQVIADAIAHSGKGKEAAGKTIDKRVMDSAAMVVTDKGVSIGFFVEKGLLAVSAPELGSRREGTVIMAGSKNQYHFDLLVGVDEKTQVAYIEVPDATEEGCLPPVRVELQRSLVL